MDYETVYHFLITFNAESEPYKSYEIEEGIYMVNWMEETGLVVSQIQDYNAGKVYADMT